MRWLTKTDTESIEIFKQYSETACDSFNACRYSIATMTTEADANSTSKFMYDFLGEGEDLNLWTQLHEQRILLVGQVMAFADGTLAKMETIKMRMKNRKQYKTFQDCYSGFSSDEAAIKAKMLQDSSLELRQQIIQFYDKIQNDRGTTIEKEKFKRVVGGILLVTGACAGVAFLAFNPSAFAVDSIAVRIGAATVMDRFFDNSVVMIEKSLAALPMSSSSGGGKTEEFTPTEKKRAIAYLQHIESKSVSETIHQSIQKVYTNTTELSSSTRTSCERLIDNIINESQKLSNTCNANHAYLPEDNDGNDNQKIKKSIGFLYTVGQAFHGKKKSIKK